MPVNVTERLHAATVKALKTPEAAKRFAAMGAEIVGSTPAELAAHLKGEMERWAKLAREVKFELAD
jgi:tripartite-type tricarboxylate transporter receptor subunit TctC